MWFCLLPRGKSWFGITAKQRHICCRALLFAGGTIGIVKCAYVHMYLYVMSPTVLSWEASHAKSCWGVTSSSLEWYSAQRWAQSSPSERGHSCDGWENKAGEISVDFVGEKIVYPTNQIWWGGKSWFPMVISSFSALRASAQNCSDFQYSLSFPTGKPLCF